MTCVVCRKGRTKPGTATVTLERNDLTLVIKHVPAQVCDICGEEYVDEAISAALLRTAEAAARGVTFEVPDAQRKAEEV